MKLLKDDRGIAHMAVFVIFALAVIGFVGYVSWSAWQAGRTQYETSGSTTPKKQKQQAEVTDTNTPSATDEAMISAVAKATCLVGNEPCTPKINKVKDGYADVAAGKYTLVMHKEGDGAWNLGLIGSSEMRACDTGSGYWADHPDGHSALCG